MKKHLIGWTAAAALLLVGMQAKSQGFYGGVRGGMNVASFTQTTGSSAVVRGNFGGFMGFQFGSVVGLQVEALYSFQGAKLSGGSFLGDIDVQLDYLKVPILAKIYLIKGLNVEGGVSFNILTSALVDGTPFQGFSGFDFSIPVGLAYQFGKHFELGVRYDISCADYHPDVKGANSLFSVNAAWRF